MKSSTMKTLALLTLAIGVGVVSASGVTAAPAGAPAVASRGVQRPVVSITPTIVGVNASHYQASINLPCTGTVCTGAFPAPPKGSQLVVTRVACNIFSSTMTNFDSGFLDLFQGSTFVSDVALPLGSSSASKTAHQLNQAIDVLVTARQHLEAFMNVTPSGTPSQADCTIAGTLYTLN